MRRACLVAWFVVIVVGVAWSQEKPAAAAKPGPELQALAGLVGNWKTEGEALETPLGPAFKWSGTIESVWFPGEHAVVRNLDETSGSGRNYKSLDVIAFDQGKGTCAMFNITSQGTYDLVPVNASGDRLSFQFNVAEQGKEYIIRCTLTGLGGDTLTFVQEYSTDGANWKPLAKSTDTRIQPK